MAMFDSSRAKIRHADRTFDLVRQEDFAFRNSSPFADVCVHEFRSGQFADVYKTVLRSEVPEAIGAFALDTIKSLREALDHGCYDLARAHIAAPTDAAFPFGDDASFVEARRKGGSRQIPSAAFDFLASLKPHRHGDVELWAMNRLCNQDKHRLVVGSAMAVGSAFAREVQLEAAIEYRFPPTWDAQRNEMIHAVVPHGAHYVQNVHLQLMLTIPAVQEIAHRPLVDLLSSLRSKVVSIIDELELRAPGWAPASAKPA